ncbi:Fatty acid oxidation complex subunit alpha [Methylobacterium crusticola]|uniref:Fatty acid oxidation complex subunit alpha n=1 Tax=Methylobacterium crusticola TaxID=1697972 RepID=A0ABQ4R7A5_9HYPH|nr:3-hydroxyacyl-CoA dehydrogenase family protein [Methylobacterium crusticola]GJD53114.1 Fatty acid oxidation complex subunit alpha [Methylobacterium crusticola]
MRYAIVRSGASRSFPDGDPFLGRAVPADAAEVVVHLAGAEFRPAAGRAAVLVELGTECLGFHTGEDPAGEGGNVLGFARYRNGDDPPSALVELVRRPGTSADAVAAARAVFEEAGLAVVVCGDQAGRIVDRLVRPKYNAALRLLDEGLATQGDMDLTCRLGLGYPDGPIERVLRGGLAHHHDVTRALFETYGSAGFAPARRAVVEAQRRGKAAVPPD